MCKCVHGVAGHADCASRFTLYFHIEDAQLQPEATTLTTKWTATGCGGSAAALSRRGGGARPAAA